MRRCNRFGFVLPAAAQRLIKLNSDSFRCTRVIGEGANHCTRGRERSPTQVNNHAFSDLVICASFVICPSSFIIPVGH